MTATCEELVLRYRRAWQAGESEAMRSCLADAVRVTDGHSTFTDAGVVAMAQQGPEWGEVRMLRSEFGVRHAAILHEGENLRDGVLVRTAELCEVTDDRIHEIDIVWNADRELG